MRPRTAGPQFLRLQLRERVSNERRLVRDELGGAFPADRSKLLVALQLRLSDELLHLCHVGPASLRVDLSEHAEELATDSHVPGNHRKGNGKKGRPPLPIHAFHRSNARALRFCELGLQAKPLVPHALQVLAGVIQFVPQDDDLQPKEVVSCFGHSATSFAVPLATSCMPRAHTRKPYGRSSYSTSIS